VVGMVECEGLGGRGERGEGGLAGGRRLGEGEKLCVWIWMACETMERALSEVGARAMVEGLARG